MARLLLVRALRVFELQLPRGLQTWFHNVLIIKVHSQQAYVVGSAAAYRRPSKTVSWLNIGSVS